MGTLISKLIVELVDRASSPARAVARGVAAIGAAQKRNTAALAATQTQLLGAAAAVYTLAKAIGAPLTAATDFETQLEDIGQKIEIPVEALPRLGAELRAVARDVTQTAAKMAEGMDVLAGMGASRADAMGMLPAIGRAATAYRAEVKDLAQAGYAALDNLKVPADQFARALDAMSQAGKAGAFELRDMAQYFPSLGAGYQALKQTGVPAVADLAAALQIVRKGAGDSAEAATNLSNILQKINAPATRTKFKKMGVDLEKEMAKLTKAGMTPIEAIAVLTKKTLKGNLGRLGDLFEDAQVQKGLRPLMQNIKEYRKIRKEALEAQGVVEEDYKRRLQTGAAATMRFRIALESIKVAVGTALLPGLTKLANIIEPITRRMSEFAEKNPALTSAVVATAAALIGLRAAGVAAKYGCLWMWGGALAVAKGALVGLAGAIWVVQAALFPFGAALRAARTAMIGFVAAASIIGVGGALKVAGAAILAFLGPIGLIAGAVAAAGAAIYLYWDEIKAVLAKVNDALTELTGVDLFAAGKAILESLWNGMKATFSAMLGWVKAIPGAIKGVFGGGQESGAGKPSGPGGTAKAGARAAGGPVRKGASYLVGERGPELFRAPASGAISSTAETVRLLKERALAGAARQGGGGGTMTNTVTIHVQAAPGQSTEAIAAAVERKFSEKFAALSRGAYSDGAN
jgi:TP901 family phage tail tape measure protein